MAGPRFWKEGQIRRSWRQAQSGIQGLSP